MIENSMVRERSRCPGCGEEVDRCCCVHCHECMADGHSRDFVFYDDKYFCGDNDACLKLYKAIKELNDDQ